MSGYSKTAWANGVAPAISADNLGKLETADEHALGVDTIAALRALPVPTFATRAWIRGYSAVLDGGGGPFDWDASCADADDGGVTILPTGHVGVGRWVRNYSGAVNVKWYGATGDAVTDDTAAIQAAIDNTQGIVFIPKGDFNITSVTLNSDVSITGEGGTASKLYSTTAQTDGALIFGDTGDMDAAASKFIEKIGLFRTAQAKTGVGIWMRNCIRSTIDNVFVDGFDVGIDTQGASWASRINNCIIQYCKTGIYHQAASATFEKMTDQIAPYDRSKSGFNGGVVFGCEIRQNDNGVIFGDFDIGGFHSTNVAYTSCTIEGNNFNAIRTSTDHANVNIGNCYFENNSKDGALIAPAVYAASPGANTAINVQAHIISYGAVVSKAAWVNIEGCYFQEGGGTQKAIAYLCDLAANGVLIKGNMGYLDGVHFTQYSNAARMQSIEIGTNGFANTFIARNYAYIPRHSSVQGDEFLIVDGDVRTTYYGGLRRRSTAFSTAAFTTSGTLRADVPFKTSFLQLPKVSVSLKSTHVLTNVDINKLFISSLRISNSDVTVIIGHADVADFISGDTVDIDVVAESS